MSDPIKWETYAILPAPELHSRIKAMGPDDILDCGWIPFDQRESEVVLATDKIVAEMPKFHVRGRYTAADRRYALWKFAKQHTNEFLKYIWQLTGSCVGAGGGNMLMTLIYVEIVLGRESEIFRVLWWLFTYGRSRFHSGIRGRGDGSTGAGWAKAITEDGVFEIDPEGYPDLPDFKEVQKWLQISSNTEMDWSDGAKIAPQWFKVGKEHLVKTAARIRSAEEGIEALINGYPLTQASNFGFRSSKVVGTPAIRLAPWDGSWSHMTYIDEYWDHPTEGEIVRWGNNWGPDAHGPPVGDEPPGGVYITKATFDKICRNGEVYAYSAFEGFPGREINWALYL